MLPSHAGGGACFNSVDTKRWFNFHFTFVERRCAMELIGDDVDISIGGGGQSVGEPEPVILK